MVDLKSDDWAELYLQSKQNMEISDVSLLWSIISVFLVSYPFKLLAFINMHPEMFQLQQ